MTDVSPPAGTLPPDIQAQLDAIDKAEADALNAKMQAEAAAQAGRDKLDAAKAVCVEACGPLADLIATTPEGTKRDALIALEAQTHAGHAAELEAAYLEQSGQRAEDSNPTPPGVTQITAPVDAGADVTAT